MPSEPPKNEPQTREGVYTENDTGGKSEDNTPSEPFNNTGHIPIRICGSFSEQEQEGSNGNGAQPEPQVAPELADDETDGRF